MTGGLFFSLLRLFNFHCKYNIEPTLEIPATKSCGGSSMTKDNQGDDSVVNALKKYLKAGFQNKQCGHMVKSILTWR